mmetsp:Transcript_20975/g.29334  ORF Transcript_20975/g.29334 Transcript_20975/m.29334 type:complete len:131 (-) Transcript_20975:2259-2651(-)
MFFKPMIDFKFSQSVRCYNKHTIIYGLQGLKLIEKTTQWENLIIEKNNILELNNRKIDRIYFDAYKNIFFLKNSINNLASLEILKGFSEVLIRSNNNENKIGIGNFTTYQILKRQEIFFGEIQFNMYDQI